MTYTRTFTLEERALDFMVSETKIQCALPNGQMLIGYVTAIRQGGDPTMRLVEVRAEDSPLVVEVPLTYGTLERS